ncbi:fasciclin domain-containing protein [Aerosakkonemataceae cyanobacterium BLCC-F154]|uniref:Fasciclin domain-containing protein n=1 Tax=Floridaenema fluviatile BLCC-F154 TaxID=3153640 RepID=A0ABV4YJD9_9CYAN
MANILDTANKAGSFNTLIQAVQATGLTKTLENSGPFTVFAPTDEAFAKLPQGTVEKLLHDIPQLTKILSYHIIKGKFMSKDVMQLDRTNTMEGSDLKLHANGKLMVDDAMIIQSDVEVDNGVIHVIDTVLIPQY